MANGIEEHGARLTTVENEVGKLREWRHGTYTENHNGLLLRMITVEHKLAGVTGGTSKIWEIVKPVLIAAALWLGWALLQLYHAYPRK